MAIKRKEVLRHATTWMNLKTHLAKLNKSEETPGWTPFVPNDQNRQTCRDKVDGGWMEWWLQGVTAKGCREFS